MKLDECCMREDRRRHEAAGPSPMLGSISSHLRWLLFFYPSAANGEEKVPDVRQRWRLLVWALLTSLLWTYVDHDWRVYASILAALTLVNAILPHLVTVALGSSRASNGTAEVWEFPASLTLLGAVTVLTSGVGFSTLQRLLQKMAVKEYNLWQHWCPDTHVTILSVIVITCVVQGVPHVILRGSSRRQVSPRAAEADAADATGAEPETPGDPGLETPPTPAHPYHHHQRRP